MSLPDARIPTDRRWVLALTSLASFLVVLDFLVVATALGAIRAHFQASLEELEWTVNAYTLSFAVLLMTAAAIGDRFGRRRLFAAGLAFFAAASAACALSPTIGWLIAARAVQGVGAATIMPLALAQLNAAFPPEQRGRALGIYGGVTGMAAMLGPVVGGVVTQGLAWPWVFWLNVPIVAVAIPLVFARMEESTGPRVPLDFRGLALLTLASCGLVWGLARGNQAGWTGTETVAALALSGLAMFGVAVHGHRAPAALLPVRLFRSRAFSAGNVVIFCLNASMSGSIFLVAQFYQIALGHSPLEAGLRLLPWGIAPFLIGPRAGALADRIGERPLILAGLLLHAVGTAWLAAASAPHVAYTSLVAPMTLGGVGFSLVLPAVTKAVIGAVAPADVGKASGAFTTLRQLGGSFGVAVLVAGFAGAGSYRPPEAFTAGLRVALAIAAALSLAGLLAALALPARSLLARRAPAPRGGARDAT